MDPTDLDDDQLDALAQQLAGRLPTGTHGDRVILSRRQFAAASAGVLSTGALMALGVDEAAAQAAGQQGTASSPNDMFAYTLDVQNGATFNGTDIEGVGSLSTGRIDITDRILQSGDALGPGITTGAIRDLDSVTSTTYTTIAELNGVIDASRVPPGATLYGNTTVRLDNDTTGETVSVAPTLSGVGVVESMAVTKTSTTDTIDLTTESSGWVEITESISGISTISEARAKVSGGQGNFSNNQAFFAFEWRLD